MLDEQELVATKMLNHVIPRDGDFKFMMLGYIKCVDEVQNNIIYTHRKTAKNIIFDLDKHEVSVLNVNGHFDITTEKEKEAVETKRQELKWEK